MATGVWCWSKTAASNANVDTGVNFAEGQSPSTINDSGRGLMASIAKYRDDVAGNLVTTGTASAYALTSNQSLTALTDGMVVGFVPHATNSAGATLSVDSLTAKALRIQTATSIAAGVLVAGTPYTAVYNSSADEWRIVGYIPAPAGIPVGGCIPYLASTAPSTLFALPYGQAISRTTYSVLFGLIGTAYGEGDSSTTFNLPDIRGRTIFGYDSMGGSSANRLTGLADGFDGDTIGDTGGKETATLVANNIPELTIPAQNNLPVSLSPAASVVGQSTSTGTSGVGTYAVNTASLSATVSVPSQTIGQSSPTAVNNLPPGIVLPFIVRVI